MVANRDTRTASALDETGASENGVFVITVTTNSPSGSACLGGRHHLQVRRRCEVTRCDAWFAVNLQPTRH